MVDNQAKIPEDAEQKPILTLIQDIKDGRVAPEAIDKELRQQAIEVLMAEGYSVASMAQIFRKCDKTVRRDLEEIRQRNALMPDIELAKKLIGELVVYARIHRDHLMRLARSKDTSVAERAQAEYYAHRVETELVDKLQTLGYLPLKPKTIVGDFTHTVNESTEKSVVDLRGQLVEIEKVVMEDKALSLEFKEEISTLRKRLEKADIEGDIEKLSSKIKRR